MGLVKRFSILYVCKSSHIFMNTRGGENHALVGSSTSQVESTRRFRLLLRPLFLPKGHGGAHHSLARADRCDSDSR